MASCSCRVTGPLSPTGRASGSAAVRAPPRTLSLHAKRDRSQAPTSTPAPTSTREQIIEESPVQAIEDEIDVAPVYREFKSLGSKVIEQSKPFEEPPAAGTDWWEGEKFEAFGSFLERWFVPSLVVLGVICGAYAANSYNEDAETFIKVASSDDDTMKAIPAPSVVEALKAQAAGQAPSLKSQ